MLYRERDANRRVGLSPDEPNWILITPGYTHWSQVTASNLAFVDGAGHLMAGERP